MNMNKSEVKFPNIWVGFGIAASYLLVEVYEIATVPRAELEAGNHPFEIVLMIIWLFGLLYLLVSVFQLHKAIKARRANYPMTLGEAVAYTLIPILVFMWTNKMSLFISAEQPDKKVGKWNAGLLLFLGSVVGKTVDPAIGLMIMFGVLQSLQNRMKGILEGKGNP